jgi:hypothetical protein
MAGFSPSLTEVPSITLGAGTAPSVVQAAGPQLMRATMHIPRPSLQYQRHFPKVASFSVLRECCSRCVSLSRDQLSLGTHFRDNSTKWQNCVAKACELWIVAALPQVQVKGKAYQGPEDVWAFSMMQPVGIVSDTWVRGTVVVGQTWMDVCKFT